MMNRRIKINISNTKICLLDGMENQFHCGFINFMVWEFNTTVKYVVTIPIGVEDPLKNISLNGDIVLDWKVSEFLTQNILSLLHQ